VFLRPDHAALEVGREDQCELIDDVLLIDDVADLAIAEQAIGAEVLRPDERLVVGDDRLRVQRERGDARPGRVC
jgi:hypothetical protein